MPNGTEEKKPLSLHERIQLVSEQAKSLGETIEKIELVGQSTIENIIDAGIKVSDSIGTLTDDVNDLSKRSKELSGKVDDLSKDVGKLADIVKSNKDLSTKVEELTKKDGQLDQMHNEITTLKSLIDTHFNELMEAPNDLI